MVGFDVIKDWFVYEMYIHISYKYSLFVKYQLIVAILRNDDTWLTTYLKS